MKKLNNKRRQGRMERLGLPKAKQAVSLNSVIAGEKRKLYNISGIRHFI